MQWLTKSVQPDQVESLAQSLRTAPGLSLGRDPRLPSTLARLLLLRGIQDVDSAHRYLAPALSDLHSPYLMAGMKAAVERLDAAIERKEANPDLWRL